MGPGDSLYKRQVCSFLFIGSMGKSLGKYPMGYALSDSPTGPFEVKGYVFDSREVNVENSIDQFFYEENGTYYMLWGSFFGIYIMELDIAEDFTITPKLETKTTDSWYCL